MSETSPIVPETAVKHAHLKQVTCRRWIGTILVAKLAAGAGVIGAQTQQQPRPRVQCRNLLKLRHLLVVVIRLSLSSIWSTKSSTLHDKAGETHSKRVLLALLHMKQCAAQSLPHSSLSSRNKPKLKFHGSSLNFKQGCCLQTGLLASGRASPQPDGLLGAW